MKKRLPALALALALLTACVRGPDPALTRLMPPEERRLTIYTSHQEEVYGPVVKEFQERTGVWVQVVTGGTGELLERIADEGEESPCDVMFGGGEESLLNYVNLFAPYTVSGADLLQPGLRQEGDLWTPFSALPIVILYNTRLVASGEVSGWEDLLNEKWRGRIAFADPAVSGSSYTALVTLLFALGKGDALDRFAANLGGTVLAQSGEVAEAVALGTFPLGITLEETALKRQAQGDSVAIVYPAEGTSNLPDGTALMAHAPHPQNARAFLEFVQSPDVQTRVVRDFFRRSVRSDVADRDELPDLHLVDYDVQWAAQQKEALLDRWAELLGEVGP